MEEKILKTVDKILSHLANRSYDVYECDNDIVEEIRQEMAREIKKLI